MKRCNKCGIGSKTSTKLPHSNEIVCMDCYVKILPEIINAVITTQQQIIRKVSDLNDRISKVELMAYF